MWSDFTTKREHIKNAKYQQYLNRIARLDMQNGAHPTKRANWLKFCRKCGKDISQTARHERLCEACSKVRVSRRKIPRAAWHSSPVRHRTEPNERERLRKRKGYVAWLARQVAERGQHPTKRANWLKFCRKCGKDISAAARRVTLCEECR
jgi:uncharacterized protein YqiB (DUF1249 family)